MTACLYGSSDGSRTEAANSGSRVAKREANGGGDRKVDELEDASDAGYCGGGERWPEVEGSAAERRLSISASTSKLKRSKSKSFSARSWGRSASVMPESSSTLRRFGRLRLGLGLGLGPGEEQLASGVPDNVMTAYREFTRSVYLA